MKVVRSCATLRLCSPWDSPGQSTGVRSLSLLQGVFRTQGSNPGLPHCRRILYQPSHKESPNSSGSGGIRTETARDWSFIQRFITAMLSSVVPGTEIQRPRPTPERPTEHARAWAGAGLGERAGASVQPFPLPVPYELSRHLRKAVAAPCVFGVVAGERSRRCLQRTVTLALRRASLEKGESGGRGGRESVLVACLGGGGCRGRRTALPEGPRRRRVTRRRRTLRRRAPTGGA